MQVKQSMPTTKPTTFEFRVTVTDYGATAVTGGGETAQVCRTVGIRMEQIGSMDTPLETLTHVPLEPRRRGNRPIAEEVIPHWIAMWREAMTAKLGADAGVKPAGEDPAQLREER